jgi:hypothetical protein
MAFKQNLYSNFELFLKKKLTVLKMDEKSILGRDLSPLISVSFKSHNLYDFIEQLIWKFLQPNVDHQYIYIVN